MTDAGARAVVADRGPADDPCEPMARSHEFMGHEHRTGGVEARDDGGVFADHAGRPRFAKGRRQDCTGTLPRCRGGILHT